MCWIIGSRESGNKCQQDEIEQTREDACGGNAL
jgi:hypothetical protein